MLIYHPAFDASHCAYRILKILNSLDINKSIEEDRIKIIDFYVVFPKKIGDIRFPKSLKSSTIRKEIKLVNDIYRPCKNPFLISQKMAIIQNKIINNLMLQEYIEFSELKNGYVRGLKFENLALSQSLFEKYLSFNSEKILLDFFLNQPLNGDDGLKARTALMEYRYDAKL